MRWSAVTNQTGSARGQPSARSVVRIPVWVSSRKSHSSSPSNVTPTSVHRREGCRHEEAVIPVGPDLSTERLPDLEVRVGHPRLLFPEWIYVLPFLSLPPDRDGPRVL